MLRPIPQQLLRDLVTIKVCTGMDAWQKPTWQEYAVSNVHLQNTNEVKKTRDNTEVVLRSVLFIDQVRSTPQLDYAALVEQSESAGKPIRSFSPSSCRTNSRPSPLDAPVTNASFIRRPLLPPPAGPCHS